MAGNLFATYNAPNPPEIQPQEHIIKFENLNPDNYYKQYIPQIIIQQETPVEEDNTSTDTSSDTSTEESSIVSDDEPVTVEENLEETSNEEVVTESTESTVKEASK